MEIKNGVGYPVTVGYKVYNYSNTLREASVSNTDNEAINEGESGQLEFFWWDIDTAGATTLLSALVATIAFMLTV